MKTVLVINNEIMGHGDVALGKTLIGAFLKKLWARDDRPETIVFYNSGVKLLSRGSNVLDALDGLEKHGVDLLACGTCLDFYEMKEALMVGHRSNMEEIVGRLSEADKVITI